jgi:uncharacterized DUF497 family protein
MEFEWDARKAKKNLDKHRVTFVEAASVFGDPLALTYYDPDHSDDEDRFLTIGRASLGEVIIVAHTDRDDRIRIISTRRATRRERMHYEKDQA